MKNFASKMGKLAGLMRKRAMPTMPAPQAPMTQAPGGAKSPLAGVVPNATPTAAPGAAGVGGSNWLKTMQQQAQKKVMPSTPMQTPGAQAPNMTMPRR